MLDTLHSEECCEEFTPSQKSIMNSSPSDTSAQGGTQADVNGEPLPRRSIHAVDKP
jgi:hypothetical protein